MNNPWSPSLGWGIQRAPARVADVIIGALLLVSLIVRLALLTGPAGSDDVNYFHFAQKLLHWEHFTELHHHGGRLVFLAVIGVPAAFFGSIYAGAVANVLLFSARDILIVCYLRKRVDGVAAASGAGILGFNALSTTYAGLMLPDGLLSLTVFLTAALVFESAQAVGRKRLLMIIGGGLLAGAGYSVKDTGILIIPCAVVWLVAAGSRWKADALPRALRDAGLFLGAFAAFVLFEMWIYYLLSGDPLYRIHAITLTHNTHVEVVEAKSLYEFVQRTYWNADAVTKWDTASLPVLLLAAVVWSLSILKRTHFAFFSLVGGFLAIYLVVGSSSFTRLLSLPVQDRYFEVIVPFLAVSTAGLVAHFGKIWHSSIREVVLGVGIPLVMVVASLPAIVMNAGDMTFSGLGKNAAIAIKALHHADAKRTIYVSPKLHPVLEPFLPLELYRNLEVIADTGPLPPGFYILHPWKDTGTAYSRANVIASMPTYLAVDEDHRVLGRLAPKALKREIVVKYAE